ENLRHEAAIRHARRVGVAELAARAGELGLQLRESIRDPVSIPGIDLVLGQSESALQVLKDAQIVERMDLGGDEERKRAYAGPGEGILRQERRRRMLLL